MKDYGDDLPSFLLLHAASQDTITTKTPDGPFTLR
jgi:hypothetical protein